MSFRAILSLGPAFFKSLRQLPSLLYKAPKTYQALTTPIRITLAPKTRAFGFFGRFANTETLVGVIRRSVSAASVHQRPNSLLRAYTGLAGSVHLRHNVIAIPGHSYTTINKLSEPQKKSWFGNFIASFTRVPRLPSFLDQPSPLSPKGLLGIGCNSAVWAADLTGLNGKNHELAVKVLYNYYAPSTSSSSQTAGNDVVDWVLLRRQLERECTLRPSSGHPNIVPIIGHFLDRSPASVVQPGTLNDNSIATLTTDSSARIEATSESVNPDSTRSDVQPVQNWVGAEAFPEGFGGNPLTYYLLMPRFDATLQEFLTGQWPVEKASSHSSTESGASTNSFAVLSRSSFGSSTPSHSSSYTTEHNATGSLNFTPIELDDAVTIAAQLFDAVAELERHGVAHRDIKADNVLIRRRVPAPSLAGLPQTTTERCLDWLDDKEVASCNARYHVALTDFGCAVRIGNSHLPSRLFEVFGRLLDANEEDAGFLAHSGNVALLAPEIALPLQQCCHPPRPSDYAKSDLWAMATLVYPLFGVRNPFLNSNLSSADYKENELPDLPDGTPGVIIWLLEHCLKRSAESRPNADLVADVLHTWTVLRHAQRRQMRMRHTQKVEHCEWLGEHDELSTVDLLNQLANSEQSTPMSASIVTRLRTLLDVSWASDWLTGPARPPDGLRVSFYRRITLDRFARCLRIVYQAEAGRAARMADRVSGSLTATRSG